MKIEIDTVNDSVDELTRTVNLLNEILEKRTGLTASGKRVYQTPMEVKSSQPEPKIIFEDIMAKPKQTTPIPVPQSKSKTEIRKRKVLQQDEHEPKAEEEDEDRFLPKIQYKDYW